MLSANAPFPIKVFEIYTFWKWNCLGSRKKKNNIINSIVYESKEYKSYSWLAIYDLKV